MALIERRKEVIASLGEIDAIDTPDLSQPILAASVELEDLRNEFDFVSHNPPIYDAGASFLCALTNPSPL